MCIMVIVINLELFYTLYLNFVNLTMQRMGVYIDDINKLYGIILATTVLVQVQMLIFQLLQQIMMVIFYGMTYIVHLMIVIWNNKY